MSYCDVVELGMSIKAARRAKGMTQVDLAEKAAVSRARIEAFENGRAPEISFSSVLRILNSVGLDLRPTNLNSGRPTLDDIREEENEDAPCMGR